MFISKAEVFLAGLAALRVPEGSGFTISDGGVQDDEPSN